MKKLFGLIVAILFALSVTAAFAADKPPNASASSDKTPSAEKSIEAAPAAKGYSASPNAIAPSAKPFSRAPIDGKVPYSAKALGANPADPAPADPNANPNAGAPPTK
jgi:hypothetical protein